MTRASLNERRDPAAERTFVRIAICIPMNPDNAEKVAPSAKAPAVFRPSASASVFPAAALCPKIAPAKTTARIEAMIAIDLYCRRRKARAPC